MSVLYHLGDLLLDGKEPIDDGIDKLHRKYTIIVLLILSIPLFTKQFAGEPIECFTPTYFTEAQSRYVNSYCWTVSTFYLESEDNKESSARKSPKRTHHVDYEDDDDSYRAAADAAGQEIRVNYYQWAPIILLVKAITFYLPFALWRSIAFKRGISLRRLMKRLTSLTQITCSHPDRAPLLAEVAHQFDALISREIAYPVTRWRLDCIATNSQFSSSRLVLSYFLVKIIYFCNVLFQFVLLTLFLGDGYLTHGFDIIGNWWRTYQWWTSPRFPLQTLCTVKAAQQGTLQMYRCHCVLPINVFNEKIFSLWWFYVAILVPVTLYGIVLWAVRLLTWCRVSFAEHYLWRSNVVESNRVPSAARTFALEYLNYDGFFILKLIERNHGSSLLTALVGEIYTHYQRNRTPVDSEGKNVRTLREVEQKTRILPPSQAVERHVQSTGAAAAGSGSAVQDSSSNPSVVYVWTSDAVHESGGGHHVHHEKVFRRVGSRRSIQIPQSLT